MFYNCFQETFHFVYLIKSSAVHFSGILHVQGHQTSAVLRNPVLFIHAYTISNRRP